MAEFYGAPNAHFWHWTNGLHFALVGLAGGMALVTALAYLAKEERAPRLGLWTMGLILLDLFLLWAESSARFRFTHIWLFLSFHPQAPIWWGSWGLGLAFLSGLILRFRPENRWAAYGLFLGGLIVLLYPGLALTVNQVARPLWSAYLAAYYPLTGLFLGTGLAYLLGYERLRPYALLGLGLALAGTWIYPLSLGGPALGLFPPMAGGYLALALLLALTLLLRSAKARVALGVALVMALRALIVLQGQEGFGL